MTLYPYNPLIRESGDQIQADDHNRQEDQIKKLTDDALAGGGGPTGPTGPGGSTGPEGPAGETGPLGSSSPWVIETAFVDNSADANDPDWVAAPGAPTYDPSKEYAVLSYSVNSTVWSAPGTLTLHTVAIPINTGSGSDNAVLVLDDTANGGQIVFFTDAGIGNENVRYMLLPAGITIYAPIGLKKGPTVDIGTYAGPLGVKLELATGAFLKRWQANGGGFGTYYIILSR